ncbi:MAG: UDP-GlcNAc:undecaprenyl-phosphate GlcNAc-1-phosphate transferase [Roseivirga sp.]|jgi:UDP-GlcNAc:undecaprenyl-phosphate GlcNAc-1-phosphate transferase
MESINFQSGLFIVTCILLTNIFIQWLSKISQSVGLIDYPGRRKIHQRSIPLVGGISIISALTLAVFISPIIRETLQEFVIPIAAVIVIFVISIYDDLFDLSAKLRLALQIGAAFLVAASGVRIESIYGLFGFYEIALDFQYAITVTVLVGSTNAFNWIDGVDGLAGSLGLITSTLLAFIALSLGLDGIALFCFGLSGGLMVFLKYNLFPAKIFLGDAGSMTVGFLFTLISIILLQGAIGTTHSQLIFMVIICTLMVPVIDAIRVIAKRYSKGNSILIADKTHLHHLLLETDQNHKEIVIKFVLLQLIFLCAGIILASITSITAGVLAMAICQVAFSKLLMINKSLEKWQRRLLENEKVGQH